VCKTISLKALAAMMAAHRISTETWELLDRCQRPDLPPSAYADTADPPSVLPELTPEQIEALAAEQRARDHRQQAWDAIDQRIAAIQRRYAPRHPNCGTKVTVALQRSREGHTDNALAKPRCKCLYCHFCRRQRKVGALERARRCLLGKGEKFLAPEAQTVYVGWTTWQGWKAYDKAIRRDWEKAGHEGQPRLRTLEDGQVKVVPRTPGRMRIRRKDDDKVLVIGKHPWTGAIPCSDAEALDLAAPAIEQLARKRQAFRLLGDWSDWKPPQWSCVGKGPGTIDLHEVNYQLARRGITTHAFGEDPTLQSLVWRTDSAEAGIELLREVCPTFSNAGEEAESPLKRKVDSDDVPAGFVHPNADPRHRNNPWPGRKPGPEG
jgi:hypothetical protein